MTHIAHSNQIIQSRPALPLSSNHRTQIYSVLEEATQKQRVLAELKSVGVKWYGLIRGEARLLPSLVHADEHLKGIVYGKCEDGFAMLAATDRRVLFVDKKLFFTNTDEVTYDLVGGVSYGKVGAFATVTLHTRIRDYQLRTMNFTSAKRFIDFIERNCLENKLRRRYDYDHPS